MGDIFRLEACNPLDVVPIAFCGLNEFISSHKPPALLDCPPESVPPSHDPNIDHISGSVWSLMCTFSNVELCA